MQSGGLHMKHASEARFCGIGGGWQGAKLVSGRAARATTIDAGDNVFHHCKQILRRGCTRPCDTTMWSHGREAAEAEDQQRASKRSHGRVYAQQLARLCERRPVAVIGGR